MPALSNLVRRVYSIVFENLLKRFTYFLIKDTKLIFTMNRIKPG